MPTPATSAPSVLPLAPVLATACRNGFAVGSFAPRYTSMIRPILRAGEKLNSPLIVQISQREMERYGITPHEFGEAFRRGMDEVQPTVPVVLHLDHTFELSVIAAAIDAGFTSVMMDGSAKPFEENVAVSREAAELAHDRGVSIEAELGKIGTTDYVETDDDVELYTDPQEAADFVEQTGVDALAVSVGTAHGHYIVRQPKIDFERLRRIREATPVQLVLHGGSGVPAEMIRRAIALPGGGISKVNIATDLEAGLLAALGRESRMSNAECSALPDEQRRKAEKAVEDVVADKIESFLLSAGKADLFR
ncbi:class II fructose-bisphosphate aldolase [Chelativorans sp.]|uniref:class II fructose-bisphosphate aldolase n=1 Tax=Chelativorans sp. TaxID=2203393 RepID=UPI002811D261|nr:class II fructose-bisphosphate aldolase [Chelativorans sp.]